MQLIAQSAGSVNSYKEHQGTKLYKENSFEFNQTGLCLVIVDEAIIYKAKIKKKLYLVQVCPKC